MNKEIKDSVINFGLCVRICLCVTSVLSLVSEGQAQGTLNSPSGPPRANQKSLQQIWDKMETMESQVEALGEKVNGLEQRMDSLDGQLSDLRAATGAPFVMEMVTVGNPGNAPNPGNANDPNSCYNNGQHGELSDEKFSPRGSWKLYLPMQALDGEKTGEHWGGVLNSILSSIRNTSGRTEINHDSLHSVVGSRITLSPLHFIY